MVSYDREDLVSGRIRWAELTPPDGASGITQGSKQQKSSGRFEPFEKEFTRKDGSRVPILIGGATFEEGGKPGCCISARSDGASAPKEHCARVEHKLRQSLKRCPPSSGRARPDGELTGCQSAGFWKTISACDLRICCIVVGQTSCIRMTFQKRQTLSLARSDRNFLPGCARLRRAEGEYRWYQSRSEPLRRSTGKHHPVVWPDC